jgi:hypothetical protein
VAFSHHPPVDERAADRLRAATVAWAALLGELHAVGFRPYLELESGDREDQLKLFCELDDDTLLDVTIADAGIPDVPQSPAESEWVVFIQSAEGGYLAEVFIDPNVDSESSPSGCATSSIQSARVITRSSWTSSRRASRSRHGPDRAGGVLGGRHSGARSRP